MSAPVESGSYGHQQTITAMTSVASKFNLDPASATFSDDLYNALFALPEKEYWPVVKNMHGEISQLTNNRLYHIESLFDHPADNREIIIDNPKNDSRAVYHCGCNPSDLTTNHNLVMGLATADSCNLEVYNPRPDPSPAEAAFHKVALKFCLRFHAFYRLYKASGNVSELYPDIYQEFVLKVFPLKLEKFAQDVKDEILNVNLVPANALMKDYNNVAGKIDTKMINGLLTAYKYNGFCQISCFNTFCKRGEAAGRDLNLDAQIICAYGVSQSPMVGRFVLEKTQLSKMTKEVFNVYKLQDKPLDRKTDLTIPRLMIIFAGMASTIIDHFGVNLGVLAHLPTGFPPAYAFPGAGSLLAYEKELRQLHFVFQCGFTKMINPRMKNLPFETIWAQCKVNFSNPMFTEESTKAFNIEKGLYIEEIVDEKTVIDISPEVLGVLDYWEKKFHKFDSIIDSD